MSSTQAEPVEPAKSEESGESGEKDVRRKFREALDRKQHQQAAGNAESDSKDPSKVHQANGPAASKRSFRRKSG
jgi:Family of unknown function (DUF5302)